MNQYEQNDELDELLGDGSSAVSTLDTTHIVPTWGQMNITIVTPEGEYLSWQPQRDATGFEAMNFQVFFWELCNNYSHANELIYKRAVELELLRHFKKV